MVKALGSQKRRGNCVVYLLRHASSFVHTLIDLTYSFKKLSSPLYCSILLSIYPLVSCIARNSLIEVVCGDSDYSCALPRRPTIFSAEVS